MRIGLVRRGYSATGGAEAYLLRLAAGLQTAGHVPVLIGSSEWPVDAWPNEFVVRVSGRGPVEFARGVARAGGGCELIFSLERIFGCDVYRAGDGVHRAWLERRAAFEPRWKGWLRGVNPKHRALARLEARVLDAGRTRRVIVNSEMVRAEIERFSDFPRDRIVVVRNGVDCVDVAAGTRGRVRGELGLAADRPVVVFVGSGWERKGLRFAVEAVRAVPEWTLVVAGRGRWHGDLPTNVQLLGPVGDVPALLTAADAFVLPTIYDPSSNACQEALAAGLPVVTTTANGFAEVLEEGVTGSVVAVGDVGGIVEALRFWSDGVRRERVREVCREVAGKYDVERNVRETLEVLAAAGRF